MNLSTHGNLSLKEKVGQLIQAQVPGKALTPAVAAFLRAYAIGGTILFRGNVDTPAQARDYISQLQALAPAGLPLLMGIDQEGGAVMVLQREAAPAPAPMALGALGAPALSEQAARSIARDLREVGFNMVYAPVADVNVNPRNPIITDRAFGADPQQVAQHVAAQVRGFQAEGILACAKHFPGHGDTDVDSHLALPTVRHGRERLHAVELVPFQAAIQAGVGSVMTAHITFPALDPAGLPATLSRPILTGLLRADMGFDGLVVTDSMSMHAIARNFGIREAAAMTVAAGADLVLACGSLEQVRLMWEGVYAAVQSGQIPRARLDEAVARILRAKQRWALPVAALAHGLGPVPAGWRVRSGAEKAADHAAAGELWARAVTVVRDAAGTLPLRLAPGRRLAVIAPELARPASHLDAARPLAHLTAAARALGAEVVPVAFSLQPTAAEIAGAAAAAHAADAVLLCTCDRGPLPAAQQALAGAVLAAGRPTVVAALWGPYHLNDLPDAQTYVCTYGYREPALRGLAEAVLGRRTPEGRLPVRLT